VVSCGERWSVSSLRAYQVPAGSHSEGRSCSPVEAAVDTHFHTLRRIVEVVVLHIRRYMMAVVKGHCTVWAESVMGRISVWGVLAHGYC